MSQLQFYSGDPTRPPRVLEVSPRAGGVFAGLVCAGGVVVSLGLLSSPGLVSSVVSSADRFALFQTAQRGQEALSSVRNRHQKLSLRIAADELFLARVATLARVKTPEGFPPDPVVEEEGDPDFAVASVARRLRQLEHFRRRLATAAEGPDAIDLARVPSRSPIEPSVAVPVATFGPRISPLTHRPEFFPGLSLAAPADSVVLSPADGVVAFRGLVPARTGAQWRQLGTVLVIAHDDRTRTLFGHLSGVLVKDRQPVKRGQPIARVGKPGVLATGPQLHYEVRVLTRGRFLPVDPRLHVLDVDWIGAAELRSRPVPPDDLDLPPPLR